MLRGLRPGLKVRKASEEKGQGSALDPLGPWAPDPILLE